MRTLRLWPGLLGSLALAALPAPTRAQPVGSEFHINTYTTSNQVTGFGSHAVATDANGNFVVVWYSQGQDGSGYGIVGQRYDRAGAALGSEFRVNSWTTDSQRAPSVAAAADGAFVVVWASDEQDGSHTGVFGQRYDSGGRPVGREFRVNTLTDSRQEDPSVASDASGNFVVVWTGGGEGEPHGGVFGQRYDGGGVPQGDEFAINTYTTDLQRFPDVASDASGNFVVVWESQGQDGDDAGVFGQRFDFGGAHAIAVVSPNTNVKWRIGSLQRIQ